MNVGQILGYVTQLMNDWGIMPFVQAGLVILTVMAAIVMLRRMGVGS